MSRTLKILSILAAVLALSAVMASAASAIGRYTCSSYPCTVKGTSPINNDTFIFNGIPVRCHAEFHATLSAASSHLSVTPTYKECKFQEFNTVVDLNGCTYTFETPIAGPSGWSAPMQIVCPKNPEKVEAITITVPAGGFTCRISVPPQTINNAFAISNIADGLSVKADAKNRIHWTLVSQGFGCPLTKLGTFSGNEAEGQGASYVQHSGMTFSSVTAFINIS